MAHTLTLRQASPYPSGSFLCNLCREKGSGPVYHCPDCSFDLHPSCVATEQVSTHFSHFQHPLCLTLLPRSHICDCCGETVFPWSYHCELCDFDMHSHCVRSPRFLLHPLHPHVLTLVNAAELFQNFSCNCCGERVFRMGYRCLPCDFDLHPSCASLPSRPRTSCQSQHPGHQLSLLDKPAGNLPAFTCRECGEEGTNWVYHCSRCEFDLHPQCAKILHQVPAAATGGATTVDANVKPADIEAAERVLDSVRRRIAMPSHYAAFSGGRITGTPVQVMRSQSRNSGSLETASCCRNRPQGIRCTGLEGTSTMQMNLE